MREHGLPGSPRDLRDPRARRRDPRAHRPPGVGTRDRTHRGPVRNAHSAGRRCTTRAPGRVRTRRADPRPELTAASGGCSHSFSVTHWNAAPPGIRWAPRACLRQPCARVRQEGTGVNLKEAAARLGVHYQTAYRWVRSGELAAVRVGARYEVSDAAIHQFVATRHSVLRQAVPRGSAGHERSTETPDDALQDLEAMAADPLISLPALTAFAARRGREVLGDLCLVAVTRADGTVERAALDHVHAARASFVAAALSVTGPQPPRMGSVLAPVLTEGAVVRVPHLPQDRLRAGLRPEL